MAIDVRRCAAALALPQHRIAGPLGPALGVSMTIVT